MYNTFLVSCKNFQAKTGPFQTNYITINNKLLLMSQELKIKFLHIKGTVLEVTVPY